MLTAIVSGLKLAATYGAVVMGADVTRKVATRVTKGTALEGPIVSGSETMMGVIDPLNIAGPFDASAQPRKSFFGKLFAKFCGTPNTDDSAKDAEAKAKEAIATAKALESTVSGLEKQGKSSEARSAKLRAESMNRWAELSKLTAQEARKTGNDDLAQAAVDLAKLAKKPPRSALDGISEQNSEAARALYTHVVDSINRREKPDYQALVAAMASGETPVVAGKKTRTCTVSGPCCTSCSFGGECTGATEVPDELTTGAHDGDSDDEDGGEDGDDEEDFFISVAGVDASPADPNPVGVSMRRFFVAERLASEVDETAAPFDLDAASSVFRVDEDVFHTR